MLFAVLASALLIAIGISIFNISLKELQISTSEEASQVAYYAADSAEECALYSDIVLGAFPTCLSVDSNNNCNSVSTTTLNPTITCNGSSTQLSFSPGSNNIYSTSVIPTQIFNYSTTTPPNVTSPNAGITIVKQFMNGIIQTTISAQGLNSGIIGRRVERGIEEQYNNSN